MQSIYGRVHCNALWITCCDSTLVFYKMPYPLNLQYSREPFFIAIFMSIRAPWPLNSQQIHFSCKPFHSNRHGCVSPRLQLPPTLAVHHHRHADWLERSVPAPPDHCHACSSRSVPVAMPAARTQFQETTPPSAVRPFGRPFPLTLDCCCSPTFTHTQLPP